MPCTSRALQKVSKGAVEKTSLQTTAENYTRDEGANTTWRSCSFQTRAAATVTARSSTVDNRDDDAEQR